VQLAVSERTLRAAALVLAILIILVLALIVYPYSAPPPAKSTQTTGFISSSSSLFSSGGAGPLITSGEQVLSRVDQFSTALGNRSTQALGNFYSSTSISDWYGNAESLTNGGPTNLAGTYIGQQNVSGLFASFIGRTSSPWTEKLSGTTIQIGPDSVNSVNSTSDLFFFGINEAGSVFNSTARIQQEWRQDSSGATGTDWYVQAESWDFLNYTVIPASGSQWTTSHGYGVEGETCVTFADYVYCVGGQLHGQGGAPAASSGLTPSYFAPLPSLSAGNAQDRWTATIQYPIAVSDPSCVAYSGYIYCVGGITGAGETNATYSAPISSSGIGQWWDLSSYPVQISDTSCLIQSTDEEPSSTYMYCIGGREGNGTDTDVVYGTQLLAEPDGEGGATYGWFDNLLPPYPTPVEGASCVYSYGIYCIGGSVDGSYSSETFALEELPSSGQSVWTTYASYPTPTSDESCAVGGYKSSIYCVGGSGIGGAGWSAVYYTDRVGGTWSAAAWLPGRPFPGELDGGSCFFDNATFYCITNDEVAYEEVSTNSSTP
jgi:hypothetical protein